MSHTSRFYTKEGKAEDEYRNKKRQFEAACYSFCISHGDQKCFGVQQNLITETNTEAKVRVIILFQNVVPTS
jgi:hypothetical protein